MRKALKILSITIGAIVVAVVLVAVVATLVINPNDYRGAIEAAVARNTDRTLHINGDIKLSLFPWLGLSVSNTTLSNAPGFAARPFASIGEMQLRVRLLSLLAGEPEVGAVSLKGLTVNLARNGQGHTNWQDLVGNEAAQATSVTAKKDNANSSNDVLGSITVDAIKLRNATINWRDQSSGAHYRISDANISIGKLRLGHAFGLDVAFVFEQQRPQQLHANISLVTTVTLNPSEKRYRLADGRLTVMARGTGLPAQPLRAVLMWNNIQLNQAQGTFALTGLVAKALGATVRTQLTGHGLGGALQVSGSLQIPDFSAREALAKLGDTLELRDSSALQNVGLSTEFKLTNTGAQLTNLAVKVDDTHLKGQASITDVASQALQFELAVDTLDIDRYLPETDEQPSRAEAPAGSFDDVPLPGDALHGLTAHGTLSIGKLTAFGMAVSDITLGVAVANGVAHLSPLSASLYGGRYEGAITAAATPTNGLSVDVSQHVSGVQFGPLMKDLYGKKLVSGSATIDIDVGGRGDTVGALKKTLGGTLGFHIKDGAIEGINLWNALDRAYARIKGRPVPQKTGAARTPFMALSGTGVVHNGVLHNDDLKADLPFMRVRGHGTVDLVRQQLDYSVDTRIVEQRDIATHSGLGNILGGHAIPVLIKGSFESLTVRPDIRAALKRKAEQKADALKAKAHQRAAQKKAELKRRKEQKQAELKRKADREKAAAKRKAKQRATQKKKQLKDKAEDKLKAFLH